MKRFVYILISQLFFVPIYAQKTIEIKNPTSHERSEVISVSYEQFTKHFGVDSLFTIKDHAGEVLVHQLEKLGKSAPQNVLIQVRIGASEKMSLVVSKEQSPIFAPKTFARYIPERFDDFAWENDVVAFRLYGKALEGRGDDAQGMDFWAKRTDQLIVNKWYRLNDYHKDHGEGLDYYSVGQTLGAGDFALYFGNKIAFTKHYRGHEVLDNGPLRTTFKLSYDREVIQENTIEFSKTISLDAGSNFNKIKIDMTNLDNKSTHAVVGLVHRKEDNPAYHIGKRTLGYWEPQSKDGTTGVALILPNLKSVFFAQDNQFLLLNKLKNGKSFTYYNGAAWDRAEKITNAEAWFAAIEKQKQNIKKPLQVKLK